MGKDLHSQKVEDWNLGITCGIVYLVNKDKTVRSAFYFSEHSDDFGINSVKNLHDLPIEIEVKDGYLVFERYSNGYECRSDEKGFKIWARYPDGNEYKYNEDGSVTWSRYADGTEHKFNSNTKLVWRKHPDGREEAYG